MLRRGDFRCGHPDEAGTHRAFDPGLTSSASEPSPRRWYSLRDENVGCVSGPAAHRAHAYGRPPRRSGALCGARLKHPNANRHRRRLACSSRGWAVRQERANGSVSAASAGLEDHQDDRRVVRWHPPIAGVRRRRGRPPSRAAAGHHWSSRPWTASARPALALSRRFPAKVRDVPGQRRPGPAGRPAEGPANARAWQQAP